MHWAETNRGAITWKEPHMAEMSMTVCFNTMSLLYCKSQNQNQLFASLSLPQENTIEVSKKHPRIPED